MEFTDPEQAKHRAEFIREARQKAWGARCHAEWVSKGLDELLAHYEKLQAEDAALEANIKAAEVAVDYHTVENRNKRKAMQERRNVLAGQMKAIIENHQQGQQAMATLLQSAETNLALTAYAGEWNWTEVEPEKEHSPGAENAE